MVQSDVGCDCELCRGGARVSRSTTLQWAPVYAGATDGRLFR